MIDINELRRLAQAALIGPDGFSMRWLKLLQDFQEEANPSVISELLDRLEAAEADALEQARLNGMGASREAALMAKLEAAEKERDNANAAAAGIALQAETLQAERDALQAKVEAMEKKEPVAIAKWTTGGVAVHLVGDARPGDILYLAPGAQPAPSVPEGWKLVPIESTPEMIDAAEYVDWGDADVRGSCINAWDRMLAAAPEAKP